ncbi:MAG: NUDIX domain-containing protein [Rikenellaceae bacterium]
MERCEFLASFHHCPKCGGEFVDNNVKSKRCAACGFVYYFNPSAATVAIIRNDEGAILVTTRAHAPAAGSFDLPGGFVDSFESAEESICREVGEECNLEVFDTRYLFSLPNLYRYSDFDVHTLDMFFECRVSGLDCLRAADDVAALQFISPADIDLSLFGLVSVREGLGRYLKSL